MKAQDAPIRLKRQKAIKYPQSYELGHLTTKVFPGSLPQLVWSQTSVLKVHLQSNRWINQSQASTNFCEVSLGCGAAYYRLYHDSHKSQSL